MTPRQEINDLLNDAQTASDNGEYQTAIFNYSAAVALIKAAGDSIGASIIRSRITDLYALMVSEVAA